MDLRKWFTATPTAKTSTSTAVTEPSAGRGAPASSHDDDTCPDDLGENGPMQVKLSTYPTCLFGTGKRSFLHSWFQKRDWLEYSVKADAAFCYPCRKFSARCTTQIGQPQSRIRLDPAFRYKDKGKEISTLLHTEQIQRNRYYMSSLIDVVEFLVSNQLPLRGKIEAFDHLDEGGSGLFMSLVEFSIRKDPQLAQIVKTIPKNAIYTSHEIQNKLSAVMSSLVTDAIVKEIGDSWFTVKVDGTRDPTGMENVSIVVRYFDETTMDVTERLLVMTTANSGDAPTITNIILSELTKAGLNTSKILSQVYDGAAVMAGKCGGVQRLLQEKVGREIPYVHCLNHQLHLVLVHALSAEQAIQDFFRICNALYNFFRKPTVALQYKGDRLKRLLDQRWTAAKCVRNIRSEDEFCILWDTITASTTDTPVPAKWSRQVNKNLSEYVVEETTGVNVSDKMELRRLYFSALDHILGEMEARFSERNSKLAAAIAALDPENETFLDVKSIEPIMNLTNSTIVETECIVAKQFISRIKTEESQQMMTIRRLLTEQHKVLEAMPSVLSALKLAVTFGASTAMCENSFSVLKNVFTDNRRAMNHTRKAQLVHLAFERDLTKKLRNEWKDLLMRKFNTSTRRLQLF
uniref:DUF4371 domain-containing protein n=1 Tax=Sinocyclocheilus anshuiensis TaxID=1608454 RepID=A0A671QMD9_9TELE